MGTADAIRQWKQCIEWGEIIRERSGLRERVHRVRYEALKANLNQSLQQIFEFANLAWNQQQVAEIVKAADISRITEKGEGHYVRSGLVGNWQEQLSESELAMCNEIAGEQLVRLDYDASR